MSEERELVKKRGSYKGRLTAFVNFLDSLKDKSLSNCDVSELQLRLGKVESLYERYDEVQLQLECIVDDQKLQYSERSDFESLYYKSLSRAQIILSDYSRDNKSMESCKSTRVSTHKPVKLPTIQLPKFNGLYSNWLEFRDTFTSLIHTNEEIDDINKFHYLRASLEGTAAIAIKSIQFSSSSYLVAWQTLCDRFDCKRVLVQNHVSALFNIEAITKESSGALKSLIDQFNKDLRALESLGEDVKHWDTLLIYIISRNLDQKTYREWEEYKGRLDKDSAITFKLFTSFLRNRADLIETLELSRNNHTQTVSKHISKIKAMVATQSPNGSSSDLATKVCPKCNSNEHILNNCPQFLSLSNDTRLKLLPTYKICYNCFRTGHYANRCKRPGCKLCKRRHNTLIHTDGKGTTVNSSDNSVSIPTGSLNTSSSLPSAYVDTNNVALANIASSHNQAQRDVLLSTALVKLRDRTNRVHLVRAVLDSGSTSSFITDRLCTQLDLTTSPIQKSVLGINNNTSYVNKICHVKVMSLDDNFNFELQCFVLPYITSKVPCREINISNFDIPSNVALADPLFYKPADIDILIGADLFWDLLGSQRRKLGIGKPALYETRLGWVISGSIDQNISWPGNSLKCNLSNITNDSNNEWDQLRTDLTKFWQLEEVNTKSINSYMPEEKMCEDHFSKNTIRLSDGRFCVRIPLKGDPSVLGYSYNKATHCLKSLERRSTAKSEFHKLYREFMLEYESLGHMTKIQQANLLNGYFIPHHGIIRESSSTTKLRVVFNASSPTSTGVSFNDLQMVGPTVQDDLLSILLRFRFHKYVLSADVEKMYRQIVVHPSDRYLQQIVWRDNVHDPINVYQLNTITYGTASASFLATRCLKQIGLDHRNPKISEIIRHDFFVDDLLTGGSDPNEVRFIRTEVTKALAAARMPLRKWKSNEPQLVSDASPISFDLNIGSNEPDKLLGLGWYVMSDELGFPLSLDKSSIGHTKRDILSVIARIFDPLGLLSPIIVTMKILMQRLWLDKLAWDQPLPSQISQQWDNIIKSLPLLNEFRVPRVIISDLHKELELHIFTDASESAYGACVYVRTIDSSGRKLVRLLISKSRVAPIKPTTIPRLELCGAVVGARLYEKVVNSLRVAVSRVYCWTDSTIVLGWLQMTPTKLQPFVRNRVAEVLDKAGNCTWRHVPTNMNPADLISRGVDISNLQGLDLWWSGPYFLALDSTEWPPLVTYHDTLPETRPNIVLSAYISNTKVEGIINFSRFSNYSRLIRSVAYVLRFINSCRKRYPKQSYLSVDELQAALNVVITISQSESFPEYKLLLNKGSLPPKSPLLKFNAYLDKNIMRVGGRLDNSNFNFNKKHPILLQSTHIFTKLLFHYEHIRLNHAGPNLLLAYIRESYWPIGGRNLARKCYHKCVLCHRLSGRVVTPIMGNLPQERLRPGYPFESTGVDYAGPIMCASRQGRGCRLVKVYIAIFICFTTKAVHLELVGDLTSNSYLLALYRFIARRGKPVNIFSDNGTSFVGAHNDLSKFLKQNSLSLGESVSNDGIQFHFIPAYTPHFGGLWEAGVKSTKYHLQRVLGNSHLTFEELYTALTKIEAILNSRPLTPLSSDPSDYMPLTPGHFLIGRPLTSLPQPEYLDHHLHHLTRFQRIEQLRQHFWSRWSKEYVAELQQRTKWHSCKGNLKLDSLVVIKEDNCPPLKWKLGRVVAIHPGMDGVVRVADIRTSTGVLRRAFNRICPLPEEASVETDVSTPGGMLKRLLPT